MIRYRKLLFVLGCILPEVNSEARFKCTEFTWEVPEWKVMLGTQTGKPRRQLEPRRQTAPWRGHKIRETCFKLLHPKGKGTRLSINQLQRVSG